MTSVALARLSVLTATLVGFAAPALAQTADPSTQRVSASIDDVSADGLYLSVGSDSGAAEGDTVRVFADSIAGEPLGRIVLVSVTRRRSVARPLGTTPLEAGRRVFIELTVRQREPADTVVAAVPRPNVASIAPSPSRDDSGARLTGRLSFDLDARETRTSWSGDLAGESVRRFATPTTRLSLVVSDLPGGITVRANVRGAYYYDENGSGPPPLSVRAYELAVSRELDASPVQLMLGRFANPYESYSAFWDGVLIRIGGDFGPGLGVVAGFEPRQQDESFSTALPKLTAFADYSRRGDDWRYDSDVSLHFFRPGSALGLQSAGWSQRLSLGSLHVAQRLRSSRADGGNWSIADARLRAALDVVGPLRLRASYGRLRAATSLASLATDSLSTRSGAVREEAGVGFEIGSRRGAVSADVGGMRRDGSSLGLSLSASARWAWRAGRMGLGAQRWSGAGTETLSVAPTLDVTRGSSSWRTSYRFYETDTALGALTTHTVSMELNLDVARKLHFTVGGERQWGARLSGTRAHVGVWRAF